MKIQDLADFLRLPALPTALSDALAVAALATATGAGLERGFLMAALVGALAYMGGMALNDVADESKDREERPSRPLPSGRVARAEAIVVATALLVGALVLVAFLPAPSRPVAVALLASIALYDLSLAGRPILGPLGMATCRGLHWSMLLSAAGIAGPIAFIGVGTIFLYVAGLTQLSLGETGGSARRDLILAAAGSLLAAGGIVAMMLRTDVHPGWIGVAVATAIFLWRNSRSLRRAFLDPRPPVVGPAVGTLVGSILWLDAGLALALAPLPWFGAFLLLALIFEWGRRHLRVS